MKHLPLFFDLLGRRVVVVGEGPPPIVAPPWRARPARRCGSLPTSGSTICAARPVFVATGDLEHDTVAQRVAKSLGVPVNVADRPALCDFILPAIVDRDDVVVAISTGGASPTLAASPARPHRGGTARAHRRAWRGWPRRSVPRSTP